MKEIYNFLEKDIQLNKKDVIVVGVSAGPDSMALLYILMNLREKLGFKIIVAHINHNIRKESQEESLFLEKYCSDNNLLFESMIIEEYGHDNFHNEARNIRYNFYYELIHKYRANYLMTGHHGDDLVETILMRIVRGSTFKGYAGFQKVIDMHSYKIVRPLIFVTKEELELFVKKSNIPYRIDQSNFKEKYTRNRYRMNVLPELKKEDKNVHKKFLSFSEKLFEYDEFINKIVNMEIEHVYKDGIINVKEFAKCEHVIGMKIIEYIFSKMYGDDLLEIDNRHVDLIWNLIHCTKSSMIINLPSNYIAVKEYDAVYFKKNIKKDLTYNIELSDDLLLPQGFRLKRMSECESDGNDVMRINSKDVLLPLRVRTRQNGDKMTVKNMDGVKKVSDILINSKVPVSKRDSWPIVVDSNDKIIWIPKVKKSKYNGLKSDKCDIIFKCL